jgi:pilus assembly protein CpaC
MTMTQVRTMVVLVMCVVLLPALGAAQQTTPTSPVQTQAAPPAVQQQELPPPTQAGPAPLRVMVGKSILINTADRLKRVSVTNPGVADAVVVSPNQLLIHGRAPGEVTLIVWDDQERSRSFDLRVDVDITSAAEQIQSLFPEEAVKISASRDAVVLTGHVSNQETADRVGSVAAAYSPKVVNALTFGPVGGQAVVLEVKFAEVDRTAITQLGVNLFSTNAKGIGTTTTGQFGGFGEQDLKDTHIFGVPTAGFETEMTINDVLNVFLFRPDIHLGALIRALKQRNLLQILAEPNLVALNGKEASFLAGGEFPFPVVQPSAGFNAVTIQFREFGVRLNFTPEIQPNGNIRLRVRPEVSALDFSNALTLEGFVIPALSTRRADTEFELRDGQSFVIAGLLDNRVTSVANKVPGLGDIPILGHLFRSKNLQKARTELMVLVTARRVSPQDQKAPLLRAPEPWLDKDQFDKGKGKAPAEGGAQ